MIEVSLTKIISNALKNTGMNMLSRQKGVKQIVYYVSHSTEYTWQNVDKTFCTTDIFVPLPAWDKAKRFVIVRKTLPNTVPHSRKRLLQTY